MSGICAVWRKDRLAAVGEPLTLLQSGLSVSPLEHGTTVVAPGAGVAVQARFEGQQTCASARLLTACDAELLNEQELWDGIGGGAPRPATADLVAALYDRYGETFVERLRGPFALVICDLVEQRLLAATDGFGIKRLAWREDAVGVQVSSRVDAFRAVDGRLVMNPRAIANVLNFSTTLAPETVFIGVHRLAPGTLLVANHAGTRTVRFWDMRYGTGGRRREAAWCREMESVVQRSVAAHCAGEPASQIGSFLSGGTDSSTVVGLMTRVLAQRVKAYSIGFVEQRFNELEYADTAARAFDAEHHKYLVSARDCVESLDDIVRSFDEPFGNSSAVATYFCARLAAAHGTTTMLAGDGGDELFGGNERYATDKIFEIYHAIPRAVRAGLIEPLSRMPLDIGLLRKARGYIRRANMRGVERMLSFQFLQTHGLREVFDADFLHALGGYRVLDIPAGHYASAPADDHLDRLLYVDMKITLADNDLPKVTRMAELAGIRTRFPFLDRSVAEFSGRVPAHLKVKGFQKRYLFKRAFRHLLPPEIIHKKKHGFGIPVALWMKSDPRMRELTHDTLLSARTFERGYFRRDFILDLFRKHETGDEVYYGDTLWTFLMLELWHRQVVDAPVREAA